MTTLAAVANSGEATDTRKVASPTKDAPEQESAPVVGLEDIDLSAAPALRPLQTFRVHERAKVLAECLDLAKRFEDREVDSSGAMAELDPEVLELFGQVDLFMEKQVVDTEAYVAWSTEPEGMDSFLRVMALFGKFTERLGG